MSETVPTGLGSDVVVEGSSVAPVVILLAVPPASGKSTLASKLADMPRRGGDSVALVELDLIAAMALPTLPSWTTAHRVFEVVVCQWARADLTCVIAEGSGSAAEVAKLRAALPVDAPVLTVAVTVSLPTAYARAQDDPSRGISRQRDFLESAYQRWPDEMGSLGADVVVETDVLQVPDALDLLRAAIASVRAR